MKASFNTNIGRKNAWKNVLHVLIAVLLTVGCSDDTDNAGSGSNRENVTSKVAVILDKSNRERWEKIADWAMENLEEAQAGTNTHVDLVFEYKNQEDADINEYMSAIAYDTSYQAIIGPCDFRLAEVMAATLGDVIEQHPGVTAYRKPMITPTVTDVEYQRKYFGKDYLLNMMGNNILQVEAILSHITNETYSNSSRLTLMASAKGAFESKGNSFLEWLGFIAEERGIDIYNTMLYNTIDELRSFVDEYTNSSRIEGLDKLLFVPSSEEEILAFDDQFYSNTLLQEKDGDLFSYSIYCTDMFVSQNVADHIRRNDHLRYEGFCLYASPESGFIQAFQQHFKSNLLYGEAQFYDAICMLAFANVLHLHSDLPLHQCLKKVASGYDGTVEWACHPSGLHQVINMLQEGIVPSISAATGQWDFDPKYHVNRLNSVYRHWRFNEGQFITKKYLTLKGSAHTSSSQNAWEWTSNKNQVFEDQEVVITYPPLRDRWALLVAASSGWANYRFQADVLSMYRILINHGYDKDHIVVVEEDDLAYNSENTNDRGAVRVIDSGDNIYDPSVIDYKLSEITPADIGDILQGRKSQRLPKVISPTSNDNVFIFWSGHGVPRQLDFGGTRVMTYTRLQDILSAIAHRKMLVVIEACYSGGFGDYCLGTPGLLLLTAASPIEECHASRWSSRLGVYLTNIFSDEFQEIISLDPHLPFRDLYYKLVEEVSGSHVKLYNNQNYGSLYQETLAEFLE